MSSSQIRFSRWLCLSLLFAACSVAAQLLPPNSEGDLATIAQQLETRRGSSQNSALKLQRPMDAFEVRMVLIERSLQHLDLHIPEWDNDELGLLFMDTLTAAADRGVRIRLLTHRLCLEAGSECTDQEGQLTLLNSHEHIEVRHTAKSGDQSLWFADGLFLLMGKAELGNASFATQQTAEQPELLISGSSLSEKRMQFESQWNAAEITNDKADEEALSQQMQANRELLMAQASRLRAFYYYPGRWQQQLFSWLDLMAPSDTVR